MVDLLRSPVASTGDRDDPLNYVSFDDFVAGSASVWSTRSLAERWNRAHPDEPVRAVGDYQVPPVAPNTGVLAPEGCGATRFFAALQLVGGGMELFVGAGAVLAPEPTGATKVLGAIVLVHGVDTLQAAARTIVTCDRTATVTERGATAVASAAGASPRVAQTVGVVADVGIGAGGLFVLGALGRTAAGAGQLVHLTNADAAAAIRGSQMLGLGRSTIYAGPEVLAQSRGWSILARTGMFPGRMTEAILLPSRANSAFLVVQPIGPMSLWQRLSGTVFSAGAGSLNLETGVFTRTGAAVNQLTVFGIDTAAMVSVRATPGLVDSLAQP